MLEEYRTVEKLSTGRSSGNVCWDCGRFVFGCRGCCGFSLVVEPKPKLLETVEKLSTGRNSMQPIPQEIRTLIERCEVNEVRFDNDDMSTALTYAEALRIENKRLCEALKRARELARKDCLSMREFAREIGVTPTQLSAWTDEIPNREPDFKD